MNIEGAVARLVQHCLWQDLPEGGHNIEIGMIGGKGGAIFGLLKDPGCQTGMPWTRAVCLTGEKMISRPRPAGLSGRVTTAAIS